MTMFLNSFQVHIYLAAYVSLHWPYSFFSCLTEVFIMLEQWPINQVMLPYTSYAVLVRGIARILHWGSARIEAPKGVRIGEGVSPSQQNRGSGGAS